MAYDGCGFIRGKLEEKVKELKNSVDSLVDSGYSPLAQGLASGAWSNPKTMYSLVDAAQDFKDSYEIAKLFDCIGPKYNE